MINNHYAIGNRDNIKILVCVVVQKENGKVYQPPFTCASVKNFTTDSISFYKKKLMGKERHKPMNAFM